LIDSRSALELKDRQMTSAVKWRHDKSQMVYIVNVQRDRHATDTHTHFASRLKPRPVARQR
jgi:hypothetical protein